MGVLLLDGCIYVLHERSVQVRPLRCLPPRQLYRAHFFCLGQQAGRPSPHELPPKLSLAAQPEALQQAGTSSPHVNPGATSWEPRLHRSSGYAALWNADYFEFRPAPTAERAQRARSATAAVAAAEKSSAAQGCLKRVLPGHNALPALVVALLSVRWTSNRAKRWTSR